MIYLTITFGLVVVAFTVAVVYLVDELRASRRDAANERRELEDRMTALASSSAMLMVQQGRLDDIPRGKVRTVGEQTEERYG